MSEPIDLLTVTDEPYGHRVSAGNQGLNTWCAFLFIDEGSLNKIVYKDLVTKVRVTIQMLETGDCLARVYTGGTLPPQDCTGVFPPSLLTPRGELTTLKTHLYAIRPFIEEKYLGFSQPTPNH